MFNVRYDRIVIYCQSDRRRHTEFLSSNFQKNTKIKKSTHNAMAPSLLLLTNPAISVDAISMTSHKRENFVFNANETNWPFFFMQNYWQTRFTRSWSSEESAHNALTRAKEMRGIVEHNWFQTSVINDCIVEEWARNSRIWADFYCFIWPCLKIAWSKLIDSLFTFDGDKKVDVARHRSITRRRVAFRTSQAIVYFDEFNAKINWDHRSYGCCLGS